MSKLTRKDFMSKDQKERMGKQPRTHLNCREATGVARPGKTAHDRYKRRRAGEDV